MIVTSVPPDVHADWNVPAKVRDGTTLRVNVFRPDESGTYPVIMPAHPYGKDRVAFYAPSSKGNWVLLSGGDYDSHLLFGSRAISAI